MRYCVTGPSAGCQLTERELVVGSYTCRFLGPLRGTGGTRSKCLHFAFQVSLCLRGVFYIMKKKWIQTWSLNTLDQFLTCLSSINNSRSLAIAVHGDHSDTVISVCEQLLQQSCGGGPWYHNLRRDKDYVNYSKTRINFDSLLKSHRDKSQSFSSNGGKKRRSVQTDTDSQPTD